MYPIPTHKEKFHTLFYIGTVSDKIGKYFTQRHVDIAFRTKSSLGRYIKNNKSKVEKFQKSGVYMSYRVGLVTKFIFASLEAVSYTHLDVYKRQP